jgi:hypothetical protein
VISGSVRRDACEKRCQLEIACHLLVKVPMKNARCHHQRKSRSNSTTNSFHYSRDHQQEYPSIP